MSKWVRMKPGCAPLVILAPPIRTRIMPLTTAYIIAARRTALGRIGGLHRNRRVEDLAVPVIAAALADARVDPREVDDIVVGNCRAGDNPARLVALASGLADRAGATTVDQQCASGLEAILAATRRIRLGESRIVVAGGVEALSMAPWRLAKPRSLHQTPYFLGLGAASSDDVMGPDEFSAVEAFALRRRIGRAAQDAWALDSHDRAASAHRERRLLREIVPLRGASEEGRDQSARAPDADCLAAFEPIAGPEGTVTYGNTSALHDGAAFVVVVSEAEWQARGRPPALQLVAEAGLGVSPENEVEAPIAALRKLLSCAGIADAGSLGLVETSESSAAQAIALQGDLGLDGRLVNPDGGAITRGHPLGAAGAVLVVRLFSGLVREARADGPTRGAVTLGASGGLGLAALFARV